MLRRLLVGLVVAMFLIVAMTFIALRPPHVQVPPQADLVFENVTVVEPAVSRTPGQTIRVRNGSIVSVEDFSSTSGSPEPRFRGHYLLPGLIDMHVHHPPAIALGEREYFALLFLAHGVTTVRNTGSIIGDLRGFRQRVRAGEIPGPRLILCGPFLDGVSPTWRNSRIIAGQASAQAVVDELVEEGFDCGKIYNGLTQDAIEGLRRAAAAIQFPLVAHVPAHVSLSSMANVEVQHLMGTTHNWMTVQEQNLKNVVETSRKLGIRHTPTMVTYERASWLASDSRDPAPSPAHLLPRYYREVLWNPDLNPALHALARGRFGDLPTRVRHMRSLVGRLHAAGIPVFAGSDTPNPFVVPGESLQRELALLAEAGLGVEGAWRAATRDAGRALGLEKLGTLIPGAPADFLLFREDPTRDLAALSTLAAVVSQGRVYRKEALDAAVARYRAQFTGFPYDCLSITAVRLALRWLLL